MGCPSRFRIRAAPCGGRGMASAGALSGLCTRADRPPSPRARSASSRAASPCRGRPAPAPMRAVRVQGGREVSRVTGRTIAGSLAGAGSLLGIALLCVEVCTPGALGCATHQCDTSFACVYPAGVQHGACAGDAGSLTLDDEPVYQDGDELVWRSAPFNRDWIDLRGSETLSVFYPPKIHERSSPRAPTRFPPASTRGSRRTRPTPRIRPQASALVRNITMGVGQPVEYTRMDQNAVNVLNDT